MDIRKFDIRVVRRYVNAGLVSLEEYEKELASLPDLSSQAAHLETAASPRAEADPSADGDESADA
jgi:hypothetical protein